MKFLSELRYIGKPGNKISRSVEIAQEIFAHGFR